MAVERFNCHFYFTVRVKRVHSVFGSGKDWSRASVGSRTFVFRQNNNNSVCCSDVFIIIRLIALSRRNCEYLRRARCRSWLCCSPLARFAYVPRSFERTASSVYCDSFCSMSLFLIYFVFRLFFVMISFSFRRSETPLVKPLNTCYH